MIQSWDVQTLSAVAIAVSSPLATWLATRDRIRRLERKVDALLTFLIQSQELGTPEARGLLVEVMRAEPNR